MGEANGKTDRLAALQSRERAMHQAGCGGASSPAPTEGEKVRSPRGDCRRGAAGGSSARRGFRITSSPDVEESDQGREGS
jgi:hypothetical protein